MLAVRVVLAVLADGINFINENDRRFVIGCLPEELAHAFGADTDEDLGEITAMHAEEMGFGLTGNRLGQHRFARARRADQQNAFGQPATQALILLWVAQEIHHLGHFAFGFFDTGHVVETDGRPLHDAGIFPAANIALIHHHTGDHADDQQVGKDHDPLANALFGDFDLCPTLVEQGFNLGLIEVRCDEDSLGIAG